MGSGLEGWKAGHEKEHCNCYVRIAFAKVIHATLPASMADMHVPPLGPTHTFKCMQHALFQL